MATTLGLVDFHFRVAVPERKLNVGPQAGQFDFTHYMQMMQTYEVGTGSNRVDAVYFRAPAALASTDIDLRGSLTSLDGTTITFPVVVGIFIRNHSTTDAEILTIGGSTNPFISWLAASGDGVKLGPGGLFALWNPQVGYATTAATADILTIAPATGTPTVSVMILGRQS